MADGENQTFASIDAYMESRRAKQEAAPAPEPKEEQPRAASIEAAQEDEIEAAPQAAETLEEEPDEANLESDDADADEPETPAIKAPQFWDAEGREAFAKLPPEAQEAVRKYEEQRSAAVARKFNEISQVAKQAEQKQQLLTKHIERLDGFVGEVETELTEYGRINWAQEIAQATTREDLENVQWHQARFETLKQQRAEAEQARNEAQRTELVEFHQAQRVKLKQIAPDLDPDKPEGIQRVKQLSRFLEANGIDAETQAWMPAEGMALAYDAARYRQLMAGKGSAPAAHPPKPPAGPTVRPASSNAGSSTTQRLQQLGNKRSLSEDEYLEKRRLEKKAKRK